MIIKQLKSDFNGSWQYILFLDKRIYIYIHFRGRIRSCVKALVMRVIRKVR